ncbi:hypothetical protein MUP77_10020 [Candidatus Bathyarchaeota archaeon]|nr:hypothetical protein [Candidatus Bathyarchaeota archaeon]
MTKTSINLDDNTLKIVDDWRRLQPKIPPLSSAIIELINKTVKELNTPIPQDVVKFEDKSISIEKSRGRFLIKFNPEDLDKMKASGWIEGSKVDVWLIKNE